MSLVPFSVIIVAVCVLCCVQCREPDTEPTCYSSWDYEFKTARQQARTEDRLEKLENLVKLQSVTIADLQNDLKNMKTEVQSKSVYTRWGKASCPSASSLVYKGYTAGKHYNQPGSGSDTVCLPDVPTWANYTDGDQSFPRSAIYGAELDVNEPSNIFPYRVWQQDIPCCVCLSSGEATLMIPGRHDCYAGWRMEYSGYLMSGSPTPHGSYNHICVDYAPDFIPNGGGNNNEHILYLVEANCGSLPCPPYVQGRELACVVCSK